MSRLPSFDQAFRVEPREPWQREARAVSLCGAPYLFSTDGVMFLARPEPEAFNVATPPPGMAEAKANSLLAEALRRARDLSQAEEDELYAIGTRKHCVDCNGASWHPCVECKGSARVSCHCHSCDNWHGRDCQMCFGSGKVRCSACFDSQAQATVFGARFNPHRLRMGLEAMGRVVRGTASRKRGILDEEGDYVEGYILVLVAADGSIFGLMSMTEPPPLGPEPDAEEAVAPTDRAPTAPTAPPAAE